MLKTLLIAAITLIVTESFSQSCEYTERINLLRSYGYTVVSSDQHKVNCSQSGTGYAYRKFYRGYKYMIVGSSDDNAVSDVDLYIYDTDGVTVLRKDTDVSNLSIVTFTPNYDVTLKVVIKNYSSNTPNFASTCRFVVALISN